MSHLHPYYTKPCQVSSQLPPNLDLLYQHLFLNWQIWKWVSHFMLDRVSDGLSMYTLLYVQFNIKFRQILFFTIQNLTQGVFEYCFEQSKLLKTSVNLIYLHMEWNFPYRLTFNTPFHLLRGWFLKKSYLSLCCRV